MPRPPTKESARRVDAVDRAMDILACFLAESDLSVGQVAQRTGLTRSRVMRLAGTLETRGFLIQDQETGKYSLGPFLLTLGKAYERSNPLISLARPILKYLVEKTGESASLYVVDGIERVTLVREEGTHAVRYTVREGQRLPLYAGASGKVLLAFSPPELWERCRAKAPWVPFTPQTIIDPDRLAQELQEVRRLGYAVSKSERLPDAFALAAPVFGLERRLVGAIGIAAPLSRSNPPDLDFRLGHVLEAARMLSQRLGGQAPFPEAGSRGVQATAAGGQAPFPETNSLQGQGSAAGGQAPSPGPGPAGDRITAERRGEDHG